MRTRLSTSQFGIDCLKVAGGSTPPPLSSGDSGSGASGSETKASSGSESGLYPWQTVTLVILIFCCISIFVAGGSYALAFAKKPKKKGMARRPEPSPAPAEDRIIEEQVPLATMAADLNQGGQVDAVVTGVDRSGIPDVLEDLPLSAGERIISISADMAPPGTKGVCKARSQYGNQVGEYYEYLWDTGATSWSDITVWKQYVQKDQQAAVGEVVQNPMNPLVGTQGLLETPQGEVTVINEGKPEVEPLLFGPVQPLLAAPTAIYPTTTSNYMPYTGLAPATTSYAMPQTTSYAGVGAYGAYGTPTYATTNYASGAIV